MALEEITDEAARIVHGTVTAVRAGRDESGLPVTWVSLQVSRSVKGPESRDVTIKQFGVAEALPDGTLTRVPGLPRYAVGDEVVLFLRGESRLGFTSPVGMGQGVYRVPRTGKRRVVREAPQRGREQDLETFLSELERRVRRTP